MGYERMLLKQCRSGDKERFRLLVGPYLQRAYTTSLVILGRQQLAEEVVRNALIETYTRIRNEERIDNFKGWFHHVLARCILGISQQQAEWKRCEHVAPSTISADGILPIDTLPQGESKQQFLYSVMSLDTELRIIIMLFYYQELSAQEIASLLNIKEEIIKSRLYMARLKLSNIIYCSCPASKTCS
ncbi:sigma-70 family RNA polymerase sigma factor [Aneurinibacillus thermoaerophilus]|uniref:Sigma-70 family RNA polymerase sigma factor n=2 Tax=Aneurinibacillus thermoaerophilus TaxID=143495 RepID=A0A1G8E4T3_ANETH|nr:sigma-70 family RNA polymerase sigma factor [Aneurinibacillus thermoaerophilus]MED0676930.1 sigma-70 family RNA polymerase sigma factor [Aneurinibacillus thermoaerophilus]MED0757533.1 sigma-70 family RNA polymerase sigma factor [Aneurinibacillus thermoaerophilus]MED0760125.1 sigma-70 family RNA polymerase sigma factor [Aneurinibacillus thermoaerophilus]QYY43213.1 sigma-70 family RNA polymerase sigma factor [Aneurinibacillus thermoaerophilus]SDH64933.1 Sigma-70, region 4 [Aneurinibacillus th